MQKIATIMLATSVTLMLSRPVFADEQKIPLINNQGQPTGTVEMTYTQDGALIKVEAEHLSPGWHGFHIHGIGDCSDHVAFKSAGGHAMHLGQEHGYLGSKPAHFGDMQNLWVTADGTANAFFFKSDLQRSDLYDADGSAFIIHKDTDDYKSQPAGNAGARIACGVIAEPQHK